MPSSIYNWEDDGGLVALFDDEQEEADRRVSRVLDLADEVEELQESDSALQRR